ncbi:MAG: flavodoxin family protein [Solobacterium sp.]|nr:flavodoxin family protein [Solobacterium sp.]MBR3356504.1 flavodoxin family protein [Solobacterium sp.]
MMKILIVNTEMNENAVIAAGIDMICACLCEKGIDTELVWLSRDHFERCISCGKCYKRGRCIHEDEVNEIAARSGEYDGLIVISSAYYGKPGERASAFCERLFRSAPEGFVRKPACSFIYARNGMTKDAYDELNRYYSEANMYVVTSQYYGLLNEEGIYAAMDLYIYLLKKLNGETAEAAFQPRRRIDYLLGR